MLEAFGPSLYLAEGPTVSFFGFPYPTRMAVARLSDASVWVWSPVALTGELAREVEAIGPVRHIVSPNKLHHLFLREWSERWPAARLHAPPGLARKKPELRFEAELSDDPDPAWAADIDQAIFRGSFALEEAVFFHRASCTAIFGDLIQRFPESMMSGWKGALVRLDGLVGRNGSTPREWRASFLRRGPARAARIECRRRTTFAHGVARCEQAQRASAELFAALRAAVPYAGPGKSDGREARRCGKYRIRRNCRSGSASSCSARSRTRCRSRAATARSMRSTITSPRAPGW